MTRHYRRKQRKESSMIGWIFKRTLLVFASWLGAGVLIFVGIAVSLAGCAIPSAPTIVVGLLLLGIGLFLGVFSGALSRWIEIK